MTSAADFLAALAVNPFLQRAVAGAALVSLACGVVGTYTVVRRSSFIAGSIAHCVLAGLAGARLLQVRFGFEWAHPLAGALLVAVISAMVIGWVSLRAQQREDSLIGAIWSVGMALGILFMSWTPGYSQDLMGSLFGNILMVTGTDLWMIAGLDAVAVLVGILYFNPLSAMCFDAEFARLRGIHVEAFHLLLLGITAMTVVLLSTVVGVVMVIALLTLPAAVASLFARTLRGMMFLAVGFCLVFTEAGLWLSYGPEWPPGAAIILLAAAFYMVALAGVWLARRLSARRSMSPPA